MLNKKKWRVINCNPGVGNTVNARPLLDAGPLQHYGRDWPLTKILTATSASPVALGKINNSPLSAITALYLFNYCKACT